MRTDFKRQVDQFGVENVKLIMSPGASVHGAEKRSDLLKIGKRRSQTIFRVRVFEPGILVRSGGLRYATLATVIDLGWTLTETL